MTFDRTATMLVMLSCPWSDRSYEHRGCWPADFTSSWQASLRLHDNHSLLVNVDQQRRYHCYDDPNRSGSPHRTYSKQKCKCTVRIHPVANNLLIAPHIRTKTLVSRLKSVFSAVVLEQS